MAMWEENLFNVKHFKYYYNFWMAVCGETFRAQCGPLNYDCVIKDVR